MSHKFQTTDDATSSVQTGYYTSKCYYTSKFDLNSAYRSVSINTKSQQFTGLKFWLDGRFVYVRDTKLPFGSKLAPGIFHRLTQTVKRMREKRGFTALVVFLDDFFVCAPTLQECVEVMASLITLLRYLGFRINWNKVVDPAQCLTFLGIEIDTKQMFKRLPNAKKQALKVELYYFAKCKRASKKQLQSVAGKLNWAAGVLYCGGVFLRQILDAIRPLSAAHHKCVISPAIRLDVQWWTKFMSTFNGCSLILDALPATSLSTDACDVGAGASYEGDWFYCNWSADCP